MVGQLGPVRDRQAGGLLHHDGGLRLALTGLQHLITITALPFTVVLVLLAVGLQRELADDPFAIRDRYQRAAAEKATVRGLVEYGDGADGPAGAGPSGR